MLSGILFIHVQIANLVMDLIVARDIGQVLEWLAFAHQKEYH